MIRILAIDDNNDNLISIRAIVGDAFPLAIIDTALNGLAGLKLAREKDPDVILLDILMPEMDGFDVCRRLKQDELMRDIPVVFLTATREQRESRLEALEIGAEAFLSKPIDETELKAQIKAMVKIKLMNREKREEKERLNTLVTRRTIELEKGKLERENLLMQCEEAQVRIKTLGKAIEQGPSSIVITDSNGNIEFVNNKFTDLTQYTLEDVVGKKCRQFNYKHLSEETYTEIIQDLKQGKTWKGEVENFRKDNSSFWEETIVSAMMDKYGVISNFVLIMNDITEKKQLMDDIIQAKDKAEESDRLKSAFLANISHEIRTPLNCIIGFSDLMRESDFDTTKTDEFATMIFNSGVNMLTIINDILDISRIESGQVSLRKDIFPVYDLMENVKREMIDKAAEKGLFLEIDSLNVQEQYLIYSDERKLKQVMVNLVGNAIKFSKTGTVEIGFRPKGNLVQFHVKDNGIGISKEFQERIFERFSQVETDYTREYGGNGLGLAISKSFVNLLGGDIWVDSKVGVGSTFYFTVQK